MRRDSLHDATVEQLVARFEAIGIAQDNALLDDAIKRFNRLFDESAAVLGELKGRPGDARHALLPLLKHQNLQVRLNTARATLAVAPEAALKAIEGIRATGRQPQAGDAGMCLWAIEQGIFKPT